MGIDHSLRCKHCYGVINSDIYAHLQLHINEKTFRFCRQICLDAYLERCGIDVKEKAQVEKTGVLKDERVKNRCHILDFRK